MGININGLIIFHAFHAKTKPKGETFESIQMDYLMNNNVSCMRELMCLSPYQPINLKIQYCVVENKPRVWGFYPNLSSKWDMRWFGNILVDTHMSIYIFVCVFHEMDHVLLVSVKVV